MLAIAEESVQTFLTLNPLFSDVRVYGEGGHFSYRPVFYSKDSLAQL